jgi:hypothetical protein
MDDESGGWLTYAEAGHRLGIGSVARCPIFDRLLCGLVHLLGRHQHDRLHCRRVALICGAGTGCGSRRTATACAGRHLGGGTLRRPRSSHPRSDEVVRIAISAKAFEAIARTLPLGSVGYEAEADERGVAGPSGRICAG